MKDPKLLKEQLDSARNTCNGGTGTDPAGWIMGQAHGALLGETLDYIKHLEDQVSVLRAMNRGCGQ